MCIYLLNLTSRIILILHSSPKFLIFIPSLVEHRVKQICCACTWSVLLLVSFQWDIAYFKSFLLGYPHSITV